jgi:hypothetical protein
MPSIEETPVYYHSSANATDFLICPECKYPRSLQITFPGHYDKERETQALLETAWQHIVPVASSFVLLGFSGEWDTSVVEFIFSAAQHEGIPVVDVRTPPEKGSTHYVRDLWRRRFPRVRYQPMFCEADRFATLITEYQTTHHAALATPLPATISKRVPADLIWDESGSELRPLTGHICAFDDFAYLENYSQLGLNRLLKNSIYDAR